MRSERYLRTLLEVLYTLDEKDSRPLHQLDFRAKTGIYYEKIEKELFDNGIISYRSPRPLVCLKGSRLLEYIEKTELELDEINKMEADRKLSIREKEENIKAHELAERSFRWSRGGIIFTSIVAIGQIIQWIIMIVRWIRQSSP